jgi:deoxyribodipyrimidine photolyase-like uncharacterized protein
MTEQAHLLVLPDQLTDQVGPVRAALHGGSPVRIIMVESRDAQPAPRHVQALVAQRAAGREFATEMRAKGLRVDLIQ